MNKFGEKIKLLRRNNDESLYSFANSIGVSFQTINDWENGNSIPNDDEIEKIIKHFNVDITYFTGDSKVLEENKSSVDTNEINIEAIVSIVEYKVLNKINPKLEEMKQQINNISNMLNKFDEIIKKVNTNLDLEMISADIDDLVDRIDDLEEQIDELDSRISDLED